MTIVLLLLDYCLLDYLFCCLDWWLAQQHSFDNRYLQDLPQIKVNYVIRILGLASVTQSNEKKKGVNLDFVNFDHFIDNFEDKYSQVNKLASFVCDSIILI